MAARDDFWEFAKDLKTRNEATGQVEPYPARFDYLHRYHRDIEENRLSVTLKARQLFITNYWASRYLHKAWRADEQLGEVFGGNIILQRLDNAKEVITRAKFMYDSMPDRYKQHNPVVAKGATYMRFAKGGIFQAIPAGQHAGRAFTVTETLLDEFAFHPFGYQTLKAMAATAGHTGRIAIVSTPNGKFNAYYEVWIGGNYHRIKLHWSDHPDRDDSWAREMRRAYLSQEDWDQEQELSFVVAGGRRVYPTFVRSDHVVDFETAGIRLMPDRAVYCGWDFGYMHPAVVIWQFSLDGQIRIFREFMGTEINLDDFTSAAIEWRESEFGKKLRWVDWVDAAGVQRSDLVTEKNEKRSIEVLKSHGIHPHYKQRRKKDLVDMVRAALRRRPDGKRGLIIDEQCGCHTRRFYEDAPRYENVLIDGFTGGYVRETKRLANMDIVLDTPLKDGWYDHCQNALEYSIAGALDARGGADLKKDDQRSREKMPKSPVEKQSRRKRLMGG